MSDKHKTLRETLKWGSYGKNGDEECTWRVIKDLSNDHLENVITHIMENRTNYRIDILETMINERRYREDNHIFVPDYGTTNVKFLNKK